MSALDFSERLLLSTMEILFDGRTLEEDETLSQVAGKMSQRCYRRIQKQSKTFYSMPCNNIDNTQGN